MKVTRRKREDGPLVAAVGGGKGGVGKSVVALNLALSMTKLGARVILVDADFGSANLHTMLGIDRPGVTLQALLEGQVRNLSEVAVPTDFRDLLLVPGCGAVPGAANLHHARKQKLLRQIDTLSCDVVVVDCGAGIHYNVVDFFTAADIQLLVANAQLISLQNAYGFLKASVYRMLRQRAQDLGKAEYVETATDRSEVETVGTLLAAVAQRDQSLSDVLADALADSRVFLLGNQLSDLHETKALHALSRMMGDFLQLNVPVIGALQRRDRIHAAVSRRRPFVADSDLPEAKLLLQIADQFLTPLLAGGDADSDASADGSEHPAALRPSGIEYRGDATPLREVQSSAGRAR